MTNTKIKWLENINEREAEILIATIDAAQRLWEDEPPSRWGRERFAKKDVQELRTKLLEFRLHVRRVDLSQIQSGIFEAKAVQK